MRKVLFMLFCLIFSGGIYAQTEKDVLRLSELVYSGSARSAAMGGAFGALGGDVSSWTMNPGSVGVFRKSEVAYTSVLNFSEIKSDQLSAKKTSYLVGSLGGVVSFRREFGNWKGFNLGISYTDLKNLNRKTNQVIENSKTSLTDVYAAQSEGKQPEELDVFTTGPFYDTYLLYQDKNGGYHSVLEVENEKAELVNQYKVMNERGYVGEFSLAGGTNYKDKLYLGMVLGVQWIFYKKHSYYTEVAEENALSLLDYYNFNEYQRTKGAGVNVKLGVIYRPVPQIRLGAAIHTPTWFCMEHILESSVAAFFTTETDVSLGREYAGYQISSMDYDEYGDPYKYLSNLRTPWRAILSLGTVLGRRLMLDVDYEYVDYGAAKYKRPGKWAYDEYQDDWERERVEALSKSMDYTDINKAIKALYRRAHHFRVGAEIRVTSVVSLRGGYAFRQSPWANDVLSYHEVRTFSGGFGLNFGIVYGDVSYARHQSKNESHFYDYEGIITPALLNKYNNQEIRLTVGVRFPQVPQD